ncbi:Type I inositol-1,4,5-trisphosphate 5-phosphatase [Papilio machaon]|uniref:inositol-polyphosphate 5-phosphatase n=1 Tax=Papilio machaon TaxID=76193 RepID=A0A0N1ID42_PAPMA|nr:Type I inositol-1,4,5-trisphosphate 5-phosphatase [Papilio machaon]
MGSDKVPLLLVTANVGSIFEDPSVMLPIWTSEFLQAVSRMDPKFIALHLQEVGGKAYEKSMQYVEDFVQRLCDCPELRLYDKIRIFLDEDFSSPERFTALGNMYFAHSSLTDIKIWDFEVKGYVEVVGKEVNSGNIEKVTTKEKAKFPQHFFPECKWSRKGFLRTRWLLRGTAVEFVNIHLFHDASNLVAMEPFPSVYCRSRRRALRHTLRHLHADANSAPYFIFGDFNFRTDTGAVVKKMTEELTACRLQHGSSAESAKMQYRAKENDRLVLTIGKKEFSHVDHQKIFREPWKMTEELTACRVQHGSSAESAKMQYRAKENDRLVLTIGKKEFSHVDHQKIFREPWLQRYDRELEALRPHLFEFPVKFPPSYPFEENVQLPTHYMKTRCPAWCDRVLLSQSARLLVQQSDVRAGDSRHLHSSRKSITDSTDSRMSSSDSSPARSNSPARQNHQSIADPTSIQHALNARGSDSDGSPNRRRLVRNQSEGSPKSDGELRRLADVTARRRTDYGVIGDAACMGDHKPIYLRVMLQSDRGTVESSCPRPCAFCPAPGPTPPPPPRSPQPQPRLARLPTDPDIYAKKTIYSYEIHADTDVPKRTRTSSLTDKIIPYVEITSVDSNDGIFVNDIDTSLLSPTQCLYPYTPESVDSHTPNAENSTGSDDLANDIIDVLGTNLEIKSTTKLGRGRSVSPTQLKSRLDMLLNDVPPLERLDSRESCKSEASNIRQELHSENSPKHVKTEDQVSQEAMDSPNSRYIHFNMDS